jgi:hypothetical protein
MHIKRFRPILVAACAVVLIGFADAACGQGTQAPSTTFEPRVGQPGKDVVWVPTPQELVEKMLDLAQVTKQDFLMDLGSGDGRTVITAAKRGLRAQGVEQASPIAPSSCRPTCLPPTSRRRRSSPCSCSPRST